MKYNFKILLSQYVAPIAKHQELLFIFDLVLFANQQMGLSGSRICIA